MAFKSYRDRELEKTEPVETPQKPEVTVADAMLAIADALKTIKAGDAGASDKLQAIEQFLMEQERTRPRENLFNPPLISSMNPLGERDHPRPELKCRIIWVGYKLSKECLTREEIELLNRIEPGEYRVTKADGRSIPFRVTPKYADNGKLEHLSFHFPCKTTDDRQNHMPMTNYLKEALGEAPSPDMLRVELERLKAELAARREPQGVGVRA